MGAGALFVDLVKLILHRRALMPAEIRALKWGALRVLGLVEPPVKVVRKDPTLMEEVFLDEALRQTRKSLAMFPEEEMSPTRRYAVMVIPCSAAGPDMGDIRIFSAEEAKRLEANTALRMGNRLEGAENLGEEMSSEDRMGWRKTR